jgi:CHAD domain-containing protein
MIAKISLSFEIPSNLTIDQLLSKIAEKHSLQQLEQHCLTKTFYDSFDWRLYNANLLCEFNQSENDCYLNLINHTTGQLIYKSSIEKIPRFATGFTDKLLIQQLVPLLEMRAFLPLSCLQLKTYALNILNAQQEAIAQITIEEYESLKSRLILHSINGYEKTLIHLKPFFTQTLSLKKVSKSVFFRALKAQKRKPDDYSSKLNIKLDPALSAQQAVKMIYKQLLHAIKRNEQGTINAVDTEFLHDFRVAIRRTRTGLSQLKAILPEEVIRRYGDYFGWLGKITATPRDLDVYVLNFEHYKSFLPPGMRENINPLQQVLLDKQSAAQKELVAHLSSEKYLAGLSDWENYLNQAVTKSSKGKKLSIKQLADLRIWKVYQRVIKQGFAITEHSSSTELHELRKACKKLRYLIEFFQSLYPSEKIKILLKALKGLQELLGDFQDWAVQQQTLRQMSDEMRQKGCSEQTISAIAELIKILEAKNHKARYDFADNFAVFTDSKNHIIFKSLFNHK